MLVPASVPTAIFQLEIVRPLLSLELLIAAKPVGTAVAGVLAPDATCEKTRRSPAKTVDGTVMLGLDVEIALKSKNDSVVSTLFAVIASA